MKEGIVDGLAHRGRKIKTVDSLARRGKITATGGDPGHRKGVVAATDVPDHKDRMQGEGLDRRARINTIDEALVMGVVMAGDNRSIVSEDGQGLRAKKFSARLFDEDQAHKAKSM